MNIPASLKIQLVITAAFAMLFLISPALSAEEPQILRPTDIEDSNQRDLARFGEDLDTQGTLMVVAAPAVYAAYVYTFQNVEWQPATKLTVEDGETIEFGKHVALGGDYIAVSAPGASVNGIPGAGAVFVYERNDDSNEWVQHARLVASNPTTDAAFGDDLVIDGERIAATAPGADGTAYLFERDADSNAWNETLRSPGVADRPDRSEADVSGDTFAHLLSTDIVLVYEFDGSDWRLQRELGPLPDLRNMSLEDDVLALGLPVDSIDERGRGEGIVRIYERGAGGWESTAMIIGPDPNPTYQFGYHVDLQDGVLAISWRPENGTTFLFAKDEDGAWEYLGNPAQFANRFEQFPISVSARTLAVGSPTSPASVFAFDITGLVPEDDNQNDTGNDDGDSDGDIDNGEDNGGNGDGSAGDDMGDGNGGQGAASDDDTDAGDSSDDDSDGDTGGDGTSTGDSNETANEPPVQEADSGGGALGGMVIAWMILPGLMRRLKR